MSGIFFCSRIIFFTELSKKTELRFRHRADETMTSGQNITPANDFLAKAALLASESIFLISELLNKRKNDVAAFISMWLHLRNPFTYSNARQLNCSSTV